MTLVVLAAGLGSRYGGLKQLDPITEHGEFIIDFSVFDAIRAGYDKVVFIIKRENETLFRETIGRRLEKHVKIAYVFQEIAPEIAKYFPAERVKPLGTAHALLCAEKEIEGPFAVINADDFYGASAYALAKEYLETAKTENGKRHFCMVGYELANTLTEHGTVSRGICVSDENAFLESITERTKIKKDGDAAAFLEGEEWYPVAADSIASMNFFGLDSSFFADLKEFFNRFLEDQSKDPMKGECFLPSAVSASLNAGTCSVKVLVSRDRWFGVTYPEDKPVVVDSIRKLATDGKYPNELWK